MSEPLQNLTNSLAELKKVRGEDAIYQFAAAATAGIETIQAELDVALGQIQELQQAAAAPAAPGEPA